MSYTKDDRIIGILKKYHLFSAEDLSFAEAMYGREKLTESERWKIKRMCEKVKGDR